jgi:hypothetical protein
MFSGTVRITWLNYCEVNAICQLLGAFSEASTSFFINFIWRGNFAII